MSAKLRELTREFARHEAPVQTLREAAEAERFDRHLADGLLKLIAEWEHSAWRDSAWARNELRDRVLRLVPAAPEKTERKRNYTAAMYGAGLKGQRRLR